MVTNRLSRIFYRISYVFSIVETVICSLAILIINIIFPWILASNNWPITDPNTGRVMTSDVFIILEVIYTLILSICLLCSIMTLIYSSKGLKNPNKRIHICSIVWGAIGGLGFSVAAGILGLVTLARAGNESNIKDVESKEIKN